MTWTPLLAFAVVAIVFGIGEFIAVKTKGIISSMITAIVILLIFGGVLKIFPADLMKMTTLPPMITAFGMGLILVNVGSMLDLNDVKSEWRTVVISLVGIGGVVAVCFTVGAAIFGKGLAYTAAAPITGGVVATLIIGEAATKAGQPMLAAFAATLMALHMLVGLPIVSFCLRKEAVSFVNQGKHKIDTENSMKKRINFRILPAAKDLDLPFINFARLAIVAIIATLLTNLTGISTGVTFLVCGVIFGALGFIEKGSLRTAGGEGLILLATFAMVMAPFVSMNFSQFGKLLFPAVVILVMAATGIAIVTSIVGKLFKWSPWLSIAVGFCCMIGYPATYTVAMEVSAGVTKDKGYTPEEEQRVVNYLLSKMLISGAISVSLASVILAGIIAPLLMKL